ncbi:MAG: hypothetical protein IJ685_09700 [Selenomonadaceae bacterium]|nr:hypothetical protein [Selenomonadaceae bacterium]
MKNSCIAFKLNYCDGGQDEDHFGFYGICSDAIIKYNIETKKRAWCSYDDCACKKYFDGKISPEELETFWSPDDTDCYTCYESALLRDWFVEAGTDLDDGKPRPIRGGEENHLCVLTTVRPNMPESDRIVFAMFIMHEIFSGNDEESGFVRADDYWRLEFHPSEVHKMKFWDVYRNPRAPQRIQWSTGLFRYFDDATAVKFLERSVEVKRGTSEEDFAKEFLKHYPYR